jgi:hypothetical protein
MTTRQTTRVRADPASRTRALLAGGAVAGPLFIALVLVQMLSRDGYDLRQHPISLLSVGALGWIQVTNFIAAGLLSIGFAVGIRRVLHPGRAGTWGPLLIGAYGLGLVAGGAFLPDPGLGFPPGTPPGIPATQTWHSVVHGSAPAVAFNALVIACLVVSRRFAARREWGWVVYSAVTAVVALTLSAWPGVAGISIRLAVAVTVAFAWQSALALRLLREVS